MPRRESVRIGAGDIEAADDFAGGNQREVGNRAHALLEVMPAGDEAAAEHQIGLNDRLAVGREPLGGGVAERHPVVGFPGRAQRRRHRQQADLVVFDE